MKRVVAWSVAGGLALAGCSSTDTTSAAAPSSTTGSTRSVPAAGPGTTPATSSGTTSGTTPGTVADGCTNDISIVNAAAAKEPVSVADGPVDLPTTWSDLGPHPKNTVDDDKTLDVALAGYEIPKDPQFGYSIPVGVPTVPDGKVYVSFRLTVPAGKIAAGQTFTGSTSTTKGDGTVGPFVMYVGSQRMLPGDPKVTITKITDDLVCGTITTTTTTSTQTFIGIDGTFALDRIQALEDADK